MHACVYACWYVCMRACMYLWMYVCMCVCMFVCLFVCMHVCMFMCMYVCMNCVHANVYARTLKNGSKQECANSSICISTIRKLTCVYVYFLHAHLNFTWITFPASSIFTAPTTPIYHNPCHVLIHETINTHFLFRVSFYTLH